ncbi:MAG TPA: hypothetical protein VF225_00560 [Gaiellaceae bacterium]
MLKRFALLLSVAMLAAFAVTAAPVSANGGSDAVRGARCVVAGVKFLASNGLLVKAALRQVDYDTIDSDGGGDAGLINADLPTPAFLPLGEVIRLHFTNPELFDWCNT